MYFPGDEVYMRGSNSVFVVVETDWENHRVRVSKKSTPKEITAWYSMNDFILRRSAVSKSLDNYNRKIGKPTKTEKEYHAIKAKTTD